MKQRDGLAVLRIDGAGLIRLSKATVRALERQIAKRCGAAAAARDDVVDVEGRPMTELREVTVLAPACISTEYGLAQRLWDR
jgi:translation initiation factor 1 (eIF-1/SUI1)